jgi:predicted Zn-dependent peptidase
MKNGNIEISNVNGLRVANIYNNSNINFMGICTICGSNFETPDIYGISHFAEHMFFKGTKNRDWKQINEEFASIGASQNAYTDNTEVLYHCTFPAKNIKNAISLMTDMFFNSLFPVEEIEKERNVIIEERKGYNDDHTSFFYENIGNKMFTEEKGHSIIGTVKTIKGINRDKIIQYLHKNNCYENILFVFCGPTKTEDIIEYIKLNFPKQHSFLKHGTKNICDNKLWKKDFINNKKIKLLVKRNKITQSQVCLPLLGLGANDLYYFAQKILFKCIGGGMYSILFSRIREQLGLCYSVGSQVTDISYPNCILPMIYGNTSPKNVNLFIEECENELHKIKHNGLANKVFECAKTDLLSQIFRNTETSFGMASTVMKSLLFDNNKTVEDIISGIEKTTIGDCNKVASNLLNRSYNWAVMMPQ